MQACWQHPQLTSAVSSRCTCQLFSCPVVMLHAHIRAVEVAAAGGSRASSCTATAASARPLIGHSYACPVLARSTGDKDFALKVYQSCNASGKIIVALAEKGDMAALSAYTGQTGQKLDYMYLLQVSEGACWGLQPAACADQCMVQRGVFSVLC